MVDIPDLDEFALAKLAREMAMNIRPYHSVFQDFNITEEQYYEVSKLEFYKKAKEQFSLEWNSSLSAGDRVKLISAAYLEQVLPVIGAKALNREENLAAATDVAKFFARNAGIGEGKGDGRGPSERFQITINIGDESKSYDKAITLEANATDITQEAKTLLSKQPPSGE